MMSLVLMFKCRTLLILWLGFQSFIVLPNLSSLNWNFLCYLFAIVNFLKNLWVIQAGGTCRLPTAISYLQKSLWWKRNSSDILGRANPALIAASSEGLLCSPGTWDGLLVPIDGCRIRLQCLETSRSLCDISLSNKWVYYGQWNANEWSVLVKNLETVFTWGNSL